MKECPVCRRCFSDEVNHCPDDGDVTIQSIAGEPLLEGRYQLERRIGQGGMGVVYQARHLFLKTPLAIKVILPDLVGNDPMLVTRFRQEALAAAAIRHQNIIAVTDFGVFRGTMPFLVMEFVNGRSLHEILNEEGTLTPARALEIMSPICAGLAAAHRQGIIHRDLKPLNIMFQEGLPIAEAVKILDFGLAKIKSGELLGSFVQAKTSGLMGSPFYMAPEQWGDEEPDARADIYSLGIILYQMLAGDVPFRGNNIPSIMKKHLTQEPPSFASRKVTVPPEIEAVVRHALAKEAVERPASVEEFMAELRQAQDSISTSLNRTSLGTFDAQSQTITTPSGATFIQPGTTVIKIQSTPPHSRVYINNVSVGVTGNTGELVVPDMLSGKHRVQILHDGYAEWIEQVECSGGICEVQARLQRLNETSLSPASDTSQHSLSNPFAGTINSGPLVNDPALHESQAALEARRLRQQAEILEEQARQEMEARRREQERLEQEARQRLAREQAAREEQARQQAAEEARLKAEAEQEAKRQAEAARLRAEEEARVKAEEDARRKAEEEARQRAALEEQRRAEEAARLKAKEEARQKAEAEAARLRAEEEARLRAEEEARKRAEAEAAERRAAEETARQRALEEERQREEQERLAAQERAHAAREQKELEEQAAHRAANEAAGQSAPLDFESTQSVRQGVITQPVDEGAARDKEQTLIHEQGKQTTRLNAASVQQLPPFESSQPQINVEAQKQKSRFSTILIAAIAVGVLLGGAGVWYMLSLRGQNKQGEITNRATGGTTTETPATSPGTTPASSPGTTPPVVVKQELIPVTGGTMMMGRDDGTGPEGPAHLVVVKSFSIDKTEVTNAEYADFVREMNHPPPTHWGGKTPPEGKEMLPVVNVSYDDAVEFAKWRSKRDKTNYRLPTEEEWEYAARGGDQGNLYPWGNEWVAGRASTRYYDLHAGGTDPEPVGSHPEDKSRWGVLDMEGNVSEWTSSRASYYKGSSMQVNEQSKNWVVLRGASYATVDKKKLPLTYRDWFDPALKYPSFGFRLVRPGS